MTPTLYASFTDPDLAEKAAAALLDHGVQPNDISIVLHPDSARTRSVRPSAQTGGGMLSASGSGRDDSDPLGNKMRQDSPGFAGTPYLDLSPNQALESEEQATTETKMTVFPTVPSTGSTAGYTGVPPMVLTTETEVGIEPPEIREEPPTTPSYDADRAAKVGVTTTTLQDAEAGAVVGAEVGLGIGAVAALASIFIPGFGVIVGGGALATALAGMAGATAAGAVAGGMTGFLKDQGVPAEVIPDVVAGYEKGGAIVAVTIRGKPGKAEIEDILHKYAAIKVGDYAAYLG